MFVWFHKLGSPPVLFRLAARTAPWFQWIGLALIVAGLIGGLVLAPPDYQQGDGFRIIYIHVPSAWLSMLLFAIMALASIAGLVWRLRMAHAITAAAAPIGAAFTFLALLTGSLWGKPMWGTYWVWDARLTSELILFFIYLGYIALANAFSDQRTGDRAGAILAIVGAVDVPIIHYSVQWWTTLHQGASLSLSGSAIAPSMLWPLLVMIVGFTCYSAWLITLRLRSEILRRNRRSRGMAQRMLR
ncbi:MAG TPA: heme ABC transporter permease [Gammaproteobacteria bacterium]|nr:heme ABC transporter permease [Gammaproteobacteria bacterium]